MEARRPQNVDPLTSQITDHRSTDLTVTLSGTEDLARMLRTPTFSLVDIWYPRGFSVSPPGQMIFLSLGMTWGWEYEMEGGHAGVLAPGP